MEVGGDSAIQKFALRPARVDHKLCRGSGNARNIGIENRRARGGSTQRGRRLSALHQLHHLGAQPGVVPGDEDAGDPRAGTGWIDNRAGRGSLPCRLAPRERRWVADHVRGAASRTARGNALSGRPDPLKPDHTKPRRTARRGFVVLRGRRGVPELRRRSEASAPSPGFCRGASRQAHPQPNAVSHPTGYVGMPLHEVPLQLPAHVPSYV